MTDIIVIEKCGNCKFFRRHPQDLREGMCRRMPPSVIVAPVKSKQGMTVPAPVSVFPSMSEVDWCGEWKLSPREVQ